MARSATRSTAEAGDKAAVRARLALIALTDAARGKEKIARHPLHEESRYAKFGSSECQRRMSTPFYSLLHSRTGALA